MKRFNKFQFSKTSFSTANTNSNNAFCKFEEQGKRALLAIELQVQR